MNVGARNRFLGSVNKNRPIEPIDPEVDMICTLQVRDSVRLQQSATKSDSTVSQNSHHINHRPASRQSGINRSLEAQNFGMGMTTIAFQKQHIRNRGRRKFDTMKSDSPRKAKKLDIRELLAGRRIGCNAHLAGREINNPASNYKLTDSGSNNQNLYFGQRDTLYMFEALGSDLQESLQSGGAV